MATGIIQGFIEIAGREKQGAKHVIWYCLLIYTPSMLKVFGLNEPWGFRSQLFSKFLRRVLSWSFRRFSCKGSCSISWVAAKERNLSYHIRA